MFSTLYDTYFSLSMHFKMSSAISWIILIFFSSGNGVKCSKDEHLLAIVNEHCSLENEGKCIRKKNVDSGRLASQPDLCQKHLLSVIFFSNFCIGYKIKLWLSIRYRITSLYTGSKNKTS